MNNTCTDNSNNTNIANDNVTTANSTATDETKDNKVNNDGNILNPVSIYEIRKKELINLVNIFDFYDTIPWYYLIIFG